ncbi:MAG: D-alanyl-D-alanine carboxypeptidase [Clostridia bacterium]|nr:D-alanyl-D-alanine carboxypeptidase [Clostridia bacterium]
MKKIIVLLLTVGMLTQPARASEPFTVEAKASVLIDAASGRVLFAQNANERLPMASTTKIMTAIIALENSLPGEKVTAGKNASGVEGSSIYLSVGEELSMEHMLYGLMLRSGNDAAVAIAEHVSGSVSAFAEEMNAKAKQLGANAHFVNPHGLPAEGHEASALAMALIMRSAMTLPDFRTITATTRKVIPWVGNEYSRVLENKNRLLTTYEGANGGKTGYTKAAGRCLVFSAKRNGLELIGTVLGCPTWFDTAETLLDYGFENFRSETALAEGQTAGSVRLRGGSSDSVAVVAGGELSAAIAEGQPFTVHYEYAPDLAAPVRKGDVIGQAYIRSDGETLAGCPLLAAEDIDRWNFAAALKSVLRNWLIKLP